MPTDYKQLAADALEYAGDDEYGGAKLLRDAAHALEDLLLRIERANALAYRVQTMPSAYTRMPGPTGNDGRVADLLSADAYNYGTQLRQVLAGTANIDKVLHKALEFTERSENAELETLKLKGFTIRYAEALYNDATKSIDVYELDGTDLKLVKVWDHEKQALKWRGRNEYGLLIATVGDTFPGWGVSPQHFVPPHNQGAIRAALHRKA